MGFSSQRYWSGWTFPSTEDLPSPGTEPTSLTTPALQEGSLLLVPSGKSCSQVYALLNLKKINFLVNFEVSRENNLYTYEGKGKVEHAFKRGQNCVTLAYTLIAASCTEYFSPIRAFSLPQTVMTLHFTSPTQHIHKAVHREKSPVTSYYECEAASKKRN